MYIAIISAVDAEFVALCRKIEVDSQDEIHSIPLVFGKIQGRDCIIAKCGIGKVNAARCAQLLIDKYEIKYVINTGSAGALNPDLKYGDIVISVDCVQFDFDISVFGHEKGLVFAADDKLVKRARKISPNALFGRIATGDQFHNNPKIKKQLHLEFAADCDEMEGAAVAQVCDFCGVPFIIVRSISDKPENEEQLDFYKYITAASENCANFIEKFIGGKS